MSHPADSLPSDVFAAPKRSRQWGKGKIAGVVVLVLLLIALLAGMLIRVPYVILRPGPAPNTLGEFDNQKILNITGAKTYPTSGALHFTTVSEYGGPGDQPTLLQWLIAKTQSDAQIYKQSDVYAPNTTQHQVQIQNQIDMVSSQDIAEMMAARQAGYKVPEKVLVGIVEAGKPASNVLKAGDQIVRVNGTAVSGMTQMMSMMSKVKIGDVVNLGIVRSGKNLNEKIATVGYQGRAIMGIQLTPKYDMPFQVKVSVGDVGGPSAGMMFTLAMYDELTPGALTGGKNIAGTGEMNIDGSIGAIGGIREKVVGAKNAGAKYFLAPAGDNCNELKGHVPSGLKVYSVGTISQSISTVKAIASDKTAGLPSCG